VAAPLEASFPQATLEPGMQIVFEAIDPTTGAAVTGVTVSGIGMLVEGTGAGLGEILTGPFMLIPGPSA
jgi:hypothetical protein